MNLSAVLGDAETATATWEQFTRKIRRFGTEADILVLAVVLIATSLVDTGFGSPAHPLGNRQLVKQNPYKQDLHRKSSNKTTNQPVRGPGRVLLDAVGVEDSAARRRAAADLSVLLMKRNGIWRKEPDNWKIPTEAGIRLEVDALRTSDQEPDLALANMASHSMGMLVTGAWQTRRRGKTTAWKLT